MNDELLKEKVFMLIDYLYRASNECVDIDELADFKRKIDEIQSDVQRWALNENLLT